MSLAYLRGTIYDDFSGHFFSVFLKNCLVAICDLVHEVDAIFHLP